VSPFWKIYRDCLQQSTRAITQVDRLQRSAHTKGEKLLEEYAAVSSIFKVASAAICFRVHQMKDFAYLTRFADELAKASQILDDFEDVVEDLERKRFNYAAIVLLRGAVQKITQCDPIKLIAESLLFKKGPRDILDEVRQHLKRAQKVVEPLGIAEIKEYLTGYEAVLDRLESDFHGERVKLFFSRIPKIRKSI
jgi:hypothetical protein